jgi:hypothetical protein
VTVCSSVSQNYSIALVPSATSYTWTVPVGWNIVSGQSTNSITITTGVGGGNVQVTATNFCGTSAPGSLAVNISAPAPTITTPAAGATVCQSADVVYTTQPGKTNYEWTILGAVGVDYIVTSGGTSTDNTLTLKWLKTGSKTVSVNYASGGCQGLAPASVTVTVNANAMILTQPVTPSPVCAGTGILSLGITASGASGYQWQVSTDGGTTWSNLSNSGFYSNVTTASLTITNPPASFNNYQYKCEVTGSCGAATSFAVTLTVNFKTAGAGSLSPSTCINTAITSITHTTAGATGIGSATGLPAGVSAAWAANTITISGTPTVSGTFNYTIPLVGGCGTANATGTITVNALPTVSITIAETSGTANNDGTICNGDPIVLTASGGVSYLWVPATSLSNAGVSNPTATPSADITYTVTATDGNGCKNAAIQTITVVPKPSTGDVYRVPNN